MGNNWDYIKLGDAATFYNGYAFKPKDWASEGAEIIRIQNLTQSGKDINFFQGELADRYKVRKGDLLISWSATLGIFEWHGQDAWLNQHIFKVVFDKLEFDKNFFKHLINESLQRLEREVHGSTMKHITKKRFDNFEIPYPPLETQRKIAAILDTADEYRQKTKALIDKYNELAQSLFLDMFGDPVTNPKGWDLMRFDELVHPSCPLTYGIVQPGDEIENGIPCVRPVDLTARIVKLTNLKRIDPVISKKFDRTLLKGGEILLSVRGSVGVASIADLELEGANVTRGIVPIWMNDELMTNEFAFNLILTERVQGAMKRLSKGATLIQLNLKDLRELKLVCPPLDLQQEFTSKMHQIQAQKEILISQVTQSEDLFNSLLQKAFKGELA